MRLALDRVRITYHEWSLLATGIFGSGIHLISGDVGSGKSTLALVTTGLLSPSSGSVIREGILSQMVSFQFPEYHVTRSTVEDEYASWGLAPAPLLESDRLTEKKDLPPLQLSRGELKRLHLSCVLARRYDLLVLDEPFSSLDCPEKERICGIISARSHGITLIFTHEQTIFPRIDYLWEIREGQLTYLGKLPECLPAWHHAPPLIKNLITAQKIPRNISLPDLMEAACRT
jgi:energy-coupling factor transport system ATP-binding protein